jgi:WD40 repeat protein
MAPEQAGGQSKAIGAAADVYALGAILYECLTGRPPFRGPTPLETLLLVVGEESVPVRQVQPAVPRDLETICHKCLHKDAVRRYAGAEDLAEDLRRYLAGEPILARPVGRMERAVKWARRRPAAALLAAVCGLLAVGLPTAGIWLAINARAQREVEQALDREKEQRREAEDARRGEEEQRQRVEAALRDVDQARQGEEKQRLRAEEALRLTERVLTGSRVGQAHSLWREGNLTLAHELLDACPVETRYWDWRYVKRLCTGGLFTLEGHTDAVTSVAFSPDGQRLATASRDKTAKVWDARTGQELRALKGHTDDVTSVAFSPDGQRLATTSGDGTARVWDARTGQQQLVLREHTRRVYSVAFSPDGQRLATGSGGYDDRKKQFYGEVRVWEARTGQEILTFKGHTDYVRSVAFSPDGQRLATGSGGYNHLKKQSYGEVKVWEARTGQQLLTIKGHTHVVYSVAFGPDGQRLATGSEDKTVKVWDARTGQQLLGLPRRTHVVYSVAFSPDGQRLATGSGGRNDLKKQSYGEVRVWDARTGQELLALQGHSSVVTSVAFSPTASAWPPAALTRP